MRADSQAAPLFDILIVADWSARSKSGPKRPTKDSIWWAVAYSDGSAMPAPDYARTRHDALERLARLIAGELKRDRRVLVGFDFPFGYPAGVAEHVAGRPCARALRDWLAERIEDAKNNANNRFKVAAEINRSYPDFDGPFWGRPGAWDCPDIPTQKPPPECYDGHPPERRIAETHAPRAKTVWQLYGNGSVGSQTLLGLPALERLVADPRLKDRTVLWPFETGLRAPERTPGAQAVIVEVYPSVLRDEIRARRRKDEVPDSAQVRVIAEAFARLDAQGGLAPLFAGDPKLSPDERRLIETEEGWILGLGHEEALRGALGPIGRTGARQAGGERWPPGQGWTRPGARDSVARSVHPSPAGSSMRPSGRRADEMRSVRLAPGVNKHAEGSCLVHFGDTQVLCTATVEDRVPPFLRNKGRGWVTGEYGMLPRATGSRTGREAARGRQSGRTQEIQRLIGRSLRAVTDLDALGERQITLDCDVVQADGGTRTAAITGAYVALHAALAGLVARGTIGRLPLTDQVAAVSCGIVGGEAVLDLDYGEDSGAEADANFVLTAGGGIVEVQCTAEAEPFGEAQLAAMLALAQAGAGRLFDLQRDVLAGAG